MSARNPQILVVNSEPFELSHTVGYLNRLGYENVLAASDGDMALGLLVSAPTPVRVLVCDLGLKDMSGLEFLRQAFDSDYDDALVLAADHDCTQFDAALKLAGTHAIEVLGTLHKPLNNRRLADLLDKYTSRHAPAGQPCDGLTEDELRTAAAERDGIAPLVLYFQPKVSIRTGAIVGAEALARWQHPVHGLLGPQAFLPLAAQLELIDAVSFDIYRKAVAQAAAWVRQGLNLKLSINLPARTLCSPQFAAVLAAVSEEHQLDPGQLTLEVSETQLMQNPADCIEAMHVLRRSSIGLAVDDFGMAQSSFSELQDFPFNELKIDRSFAHGAARNAEQRAILEASIELARLLALDVVAVGVEDREDWDVVEKLGCDLVQGYYCAMPMHADALVEFIRHWRGPHHGR